jgi:hypothetical protein
MGESKEQSDSAAAVAEYVKKMNRKLDVVERLARLYNKYLYFSNDDTERPYAMMGFGSALAEGWMDEGKMKAEDRMGPVMDQLHQKYQTAEDYVKEHYGKAILYARENFKFLTRDAEFNFFSPDDGEGFLQRALRPYMSSSRTVPTRRI